MLKRYNDFVRGRLNESSEYLISENIDSAKTFLKKKYLEEKRSRAQGVDPKTIGLTPAEQRIAESDPNFQRIRQMIGKNLHYAYGFVKFFYDDLSDQPEEIRFEELSTLQKDLEYLYVVKANLPKPFDQYIKVKATEDDPRSAYERLRDDIEILKGDILTRTWVNQLMGFQKDWFKNLNPVQKSRIDSIAKEFSLMGKDEYGNVDKQINRDLQRLFFKAVGRYKTLGDLIIAAESAIKASNNANMVTFLLACERVNNKYGDANGAVEVYNGENILIIEVKSFQANRELNGATSHCIAQRLSAWETYLADQLFTKQYYIYNFNLSPSDTKSVIGITIGPGGTVKACHKKDDGGFSNNIESYMIRELGIPMSVLAPLTPEEIEARKRRIEANKLIVNSNIPLDQMKDLIQMGGDPNCGSGKPLQNSVKEGDFEKTEYLLEMGANPNIANAIIYAKTLEMIKLLVRYGSSINSDVFNNIINDPDAVEYVLTTGTGVDPNFDNGFPIRQASRMGNLETLEILVKYGADLTVKKYQPIKTAVEHGHLHLIKNMFKKLRRMKDPVIMDEKVRKDYFDKWINFAKTSEKTDRIVNGVNLRDSVIELLEHYATCPIDQIGN